MAHGMGHWMLYIITYAYGCGYIVYAYAQPGPRLWVIDQPFIFYYEFFTHCTATLRVESWVPMSITLSVCEHHWLYELHNFAADNKYTVILAY